MAILVQSEILKLLSVASIYFIYGVWRQNEKPLI